MLQHVSLLQVNAKLQPARNRAGLDWDQLEEQAAAEDREKDFSDDADEDYKRKRKTMGGGGGGKKAKR